MNNICHVRQLRNIGLSLLTAAVQLYQQQDCSYAVGLPPLLGMHMQSHRNMEQTANGVSALVPHVSKSEDHMCTAQDYVKGLHCYLTSRGDQESSSASLILVV